MKKTFLLVAFVFALSLSACVSNGAQSSSNNSKPYIIDPTKGQITYGLYPQKNVSDASLILELNKITTPESNGWYLYNNEYYAKTEGRPYSGGTVFDNGTRIQNGKMYWFKCEPIVWNVVKSENNRYYLISSVILDVHQYSSSSGNYINSEIRSWLNDNFYHSAFMDGETYVATIAVDNSASTTDSETNPYICENSNDKAFLQSYQDYSQITEESRLCLSTEWARTKGIQGKSNFCSSYWTRSPDSNQNIGAFIVNFNGGLDGCHVVNTSIGVRPSICLLA